MKKLLNRIYRIFVAWFKPKYKTVYTEDLPLAIQATTLYLVGEQNQPWQAAFICPCGCGALIQLSLLEDSYPKWEVSFINDNVSLSPSVHRIVGCKSHFYLKRGQIEWVKSISYRAFRSKNKK